MKSKIHEYLNLKTKTMRKKLILLLSVASLVMVGTQSCKKKEGPPKPAIKQTVNTQLKANEAYTFTLPRNTRNDEYEITANASHASISKIGVDASGNYIYQYTPALNYAGTDQVVLANDEELREPQNHPKPHPHGGCNNGGQEDHYIVTINFTIVNLTEEGRPSLKSVSNF